MPALTVRFAIFEYVCESVDGWTWYKTRMITTNSSRIIGIILQKGTHAGCGSLQATRAARKRRRIPHAAVHVMDFKTQKCTVKLCKRIFPDHVRILYKHTHTHISLTIEEQ